MKGIDLARGYYEEYGKPMLERDFPELLPLLAAGFTGSGSEHFGFDDEVSHDHDFEPGFCLFLPSEELIDRQTAFRLERAYAKLPKEYEGVTRELLSPVGGKRNGVLRTAEFYRAAVGSPNGELSEEAWLHIPDYALAEATNGAVFFDGLGEVTRIRASLAAMPRDVRLKRLAGQLLLMAQAGQYNYRRCLSHGEPEAALLAANEFVTASLKAIFLLHGSYCPYYKWSFRALRALPNGGFFADRLGYLLGGDDADEKYNVLEEVASEVITLLQESHLTEAVCGDLEKHAYSVNDRIENPSLRNANILEAV